MPNMHWLEDPLVMQQWEEICDLATKLESKLKTINWEMEGNLYKSELNIATRLKESAEVQFVHWKWVCEGMKGPDPSIELKREQRCRYREKSLEKDLKLTNQSK